MASENPGDIGTKTGHPSHGRTEANKDEAAAAATHSTNPANFANR